MKKLALHYVGMLSLNGLCILLANTVAPSGAPALWVQLLLLLGAPMLVMGATFWANRGDVTDDGSA